MDDDELAGGLSMDEDEVRESPNPKARKHRRAPVAALAVPAAPNAAAVVKQDETTLGEIRDLIVGMQTQLACIPTLTQTVNDQTSKLRALEERIQRLEAGSTRSAQDSVVGPASLISGLSAQSISIPVTSKWLAGGFKDIDELQKAKQELEKLAPTYVDSWNTKGDRPMLFITLLNDFDRLNFHIAAQKHLRATYPHAWAKLGRSKQEEHEHTKVVQFKKFLQLHVGQNCHDISTDDITMRAKDATVLWKQEKIARFQNGLERYNWKVLEVSFKLTKQAILDGMIALDEQP
eukprot:6491863-Amphidinium_carterae.2